MATKKTYIEHDGKRYELCCANSRNHGECYRSCAFRKIDGTFHGQPDYCSKKCYLPKWFENLKLFADVWLVKTGEPCANADHRKQRGRTAPNRALKKGRSK